MSSLIAQVFALEEQVGQVLACFDRAPSAEVDQKMRMIEGALSVFKSRLSVLLDADTYQAAVPEVP